MQRTARRAGHGIGARRLLLAGLAVIAGGVLTACGQAQPGVAATIDGNTLSVIEAQQRAADFFESYPEAAQAVSVDRVTAITVENFLRGKIVDTIGVAYGVEPTPGELEQFVVDNYGSMEDFTNQVSGIGVASNRPELVQAELRSAWIQNAVRDIKAEEIDDPEQVDIATRAVLDEYSAKADVSVNPRFGIWNGSIVTSASESGSGSISILPTSGTGTEDTRAPTG